MTKKKKTLLMFFISLFSIALISIGTYALWNAGSDLLTGTNTIQSGQVKMSYTEENSLKLDNALPMKDEDGKKLDTYFDFTVSSWIKTNKNDSTERKLSYNIVLEPTILSLTGNGETIEFTPSSEYWNMVLDDICATFKVYLTTIDADGNEKEVTGPILIGELNNYILKSQEEIFKNGKEQVDTKYRLRSWIDFYFNPSGFEGDKLQYKFRVNINSKAESYTDSDYALEFAKENVGKNGLEEVTHEKDSSLQISDAVTEYRYRGASPNNYVVFNNELWRIIGIIPTENISGNVDNSFKIIKSSSIGKYSWDSDTEISYIENNNDIKLLNNYNSSNDISNLIEYNNNYNVTRTESIDKCINCSNNWARPSTLNTYLNSDYYNTLNESSKKLIRTIKYYLGGYSDAEITTKDMWSYERKKSNGSDCVLDEDGNQSGTQCYYYRNNPTNHVNKIALMYASDYGYAATGCDDKLLYNYDDGSGIHTCNSSNWLYSKSDEWFIDQMSTNSSYSFNTYNYGYLIGSGSVSESYDIRPVLSLSSNAKVLSGSGTLSDPYKFDNINLETITFKYYLGRDTSEIHTAQAIKGMSWQDFINSSYNTFITVSEKVFDEDENRISYVSEIVSGMTYSIHSDK